MHTVNTKYKVRMLPSCAFSRRNQCAARYVTVLCCYRGVAKATDSWWYRLQCTEKLLSACGECKKNTSTAHVLHWMICVIIRHNNNADGAFRQCCTAVHTGWCIGQHFGPSNQPDGYYCRPTDTGMGQVAWYKLRWWLWFMKMHTMAF